MEPSKIGSYSQTQLRPLSPLLSYLDSSPLPTLVLPFASSPALFDLHAPPLLSNYALHLLTHSHALLSILSPASLAALRTWLLADPTNTQDVELDLILGTVEAGTWRLLTVRWRRSFAPEGEGRIVVLTALIFPPTRLAGASLVSPSVVVPAREARPIEERLRELELLTDCSAVGLARLDLEGRVTWVNASWREITKHPPELRLDEWARGVDPEDYEALAELWAVSRKELRPMVTRFKMKSGTIVLAHCTPNNSDPEHVTGWITNLTDVTAAVRAEEAVGLLAIERAAAARQAHAIEVAEARRIEAEEQRRQQELLIDVTSHEIRNPISAILNNSDLTRSSLVALRETLLALDLNSQLPSQLGDTIPQLEEDIEAIESISECAMAQERIANDILGLAQIQIKRYSITPVAFCLRTSLRGTLRMFANEARAKGIELQLCLGESLDRLGEHGQIMADPVRLSQILINLVSNAVRFTAGSQICRVTLTIDVSSVPPEPTAPLIPPNDKDFAIEPSSPLYLFFAVEDTGPGMTQDEAERVFEQFMQATPLTHVKMGGSGLGLWIARNLCELHGGKIEVASAPLLGSTFRGYVLASLPPAPSLPSPPRTVRCPLLPLRVLVVDDNQINRTILKRQLGLAGHVVDVCRDGREAVEMCGSGERFDCILMDVEMPVMGGLAATRAVRALEEAKGRSRLRIVGCTGNARDEQVQLALAAGMDALVAKPYRIAELLEQLVPAS